MSEHVLVLRTCNPDGKSRHGFKWPKSGPVECPDWDPEPECGNGLHGLLWGEGDYELLDWTAGAVWLVVKVNQEDIVDLKGKVKFPRGEVVHCGTRKSATEYILDNGGWGHAVVGASVVVGKHGRVVVGAKGTATAGDYGTAAAGEGGKAEAGYEGRAFTEDFGIAIAGDNGRAKAGYHGMAKAGKDGEAVAGNYGMAVAGKGGKAEAGYRGIAKVGKDGSAYVGEDGAAAADEGGTIVIHYSDDEGGEKTVVGKVGEAGLLPNILYVVSEGKLVPADK